MQSAWDSNPQKEMNFHLTSPPRHNGELDKHIVNKFNEKNCESFIFFLLYDLFFTKKTILNSNSSWLGIFLSVGIVCLELHTIVACNSRERTSIYIE